VIAGDLDYYTNGTAWEPHIFRGECVRLFLYTRWFYYANSQGGLFE
jgi:hypothetical protein